ncbi:MAG: hypothetical protein GQ569_00295 [Methylococcaceae bacterium]|nr:hypothetical protein [Methylococcaceae bacterium]
MLFPVFKVDTIVAKIFDGTGYPDKLKGEDIPIGARIVADAYSALTAWRPYRGKWDCQAALTEIKEDAEKGKFDPQVIAALESFVGSSNGMTLNRNA